MIGRGRERGGVGGVEGGGRHHTAIRPHPPSPITTPLSPHPPHRNDVIRKDGSHVERPVSHHLKVGPCVNKPEKGFK